MAKLNRVRQISGVELLFLDARIHVLVFELLQGESGRSKALDTYEPQLNGKSVTDTVPRVSESTQSAPRCRDKDVVAFRV